MGMMIDEAIPILHDLYNYYNDVDVDAYVGFDKEDNNAIETALETMRKYQQLEDFARWVAEEIIDEELWTFNHLSFAELTCRKLVQLGILQESDGEYTYEVVEDGND